VINDQPDIRTMISIVLRIHISKLPALPALPPDRRCSRTPAFDIAIVDIFLERKNLKKIENSPSREQY
jgi:hypothetical protein